MASRTSHQDGGIGRYTLPPPTTKRKTTNLKTKDNQKFQVIKLHGSLTTKELEKKHLSRLVGEAEMGSWVEKTCSNAAAGELGWARWWLGVGAVPHPCADKLGGTTGELDRPFKPEFQHRKRKSQNL